MKIKKSSDKVSLLRQLLTVKGKFSESFALVAGEGYSDRYMDQLRTELSSCSRKRDIAQGQSLLAQAMLFRGELRGAYEQFEAVDIKLVPKEMRGVFAANYLMCVFFLGKTGRVKQLYRELNEWLLSENTPQMRRSVGINEYIEGRYENAVTVFVKLLEFSDPKATLFIDYCLVRSMLALDMYGEAAELADKGFSRYNGRKEITAEINKLRNRISAGQRQNGNYRKGDKKKRRK
ncbi:MAG: hypothetical protein LIO69_07310 [Oscillospiraceae bacterium]|nr:hypothetical protein [Oscillospiraceae bacterium]